MSAVAFLWLGLATTVFVAANAVLKVYAVKGGLPVLIAALALFCVGNWLMVAISVMAIFVFGERPTGLQMAGMALGCVAVAMIAWPTGAKG